MANEKFFLHPEEFGRAMVPKRFRSSLRRYLLKAGYNKVPYTTYGYLFYLSVLVTGFALVTLFFPFIQGYSPISQLILIFIFWSITQLLIVILTISLVYIYYDMIITKRTREMEDIIEDFLRYVSENLKGGMAFERALLAAIKPKFGILAEEIKLISKKIMTGQDMEDALLEFTEKYDSPLLRRSFQLIIEGLKGGGRITDIIDRTEDTIRETKELKKEMITTNKTYGIFLNFIVMVIAPTLFSLSYTLVQILKSLAGKIQLTGISSSTFSLDLSYLIENEALDNNFATFSIGALVILAITTSSINSIITNGNIKEGIKYMPSYVLISVILYFIIRSVFLLLFGGLIG